MLNPDILLQKYTATKNSDDFDKLAKSFEKMIYDQMRYLKVDRFDCKEDLFQEGMIAAYEATNDFDISRGVKFTTYLHNEIRGALTHYIRDFVNSHVPAHVFEYRFTINKAQATLDNKLGRVSTDEELAEYLGMPYTKLTKYKNIIANSDIYSYDILLNSNEPLYTPSFDFNLTDEEIKLKEYVNQVVQLTKEKKSIFDISKKTNLSVKNIRLLKEYAQDNLLL